MTLKRICVFCASSRGTNPLYETQARALAFLLCEQGLGLVFGGSSCGLMGVLADAMLEKGGEVIGVLPKNLMRREIAHPHLKDLRIVDSMHDRKALMNELSDAFIAMPGGFGTLEEFFEVVTWLQLGLHQKPTALLNVSGYYDSLLELLKRGVRDQLVRPENADLVLSDSNPEALLKKIKNFKPHLVPKWIEAPVKP